jgi:hypothetical protein
MLAGTKGFAHPSAVLSNSKDAGRSAHRTPPRGWAGCGVPVCLAWAILVTSAPHVSAQKASSAAAWTFESSVNTYLLPDDNNYVQPTIAADRAWLHLDLRVNHEDLDTGADSIWLQLFRGRDIRMGSDASARWGLRPDGG